MQPSHELPAFLVEHLSRGQAAAPTGAISQQELVSRTFETDRGSQFFDAVSVPEAAEIAAEVRRLRPEHSLEIGCCSGASALCILHALEGNGRGTHHVIDPFQTSYARGAGLANIRAAGLTERLDFHEAFPEAVVPGLPRLQFAFIDASHLFDLSILDFVLVDKRLDVGGVVALHDLWMPSLQDVVRCILANRSYRALHVQQAPPATARARLRRWLGAGLSRLPRAADFFRGELLQPWESLGLGNLVFLEKTGEDTRGWCDHVRF
ncbi:MAG: class I SAM-dependent methyltransferase [Verrucomicrobia bacterium]|nr:class I SAM-dependent methyltransferase [Verrucomicrobiota bacterium]